MLALCFHHDDRASHLRFSPTRIRPVSLGMAAPARDPWTPPEPAWPSARRANVAWLSQWVWALGLSSVAHAALGVALVQWGLGHLAAQPLSTAHGRASIEQLASQASQASPEVTSPSEELSTATIAIEVVEVVPSASGGGEEGALLPATPEVTRARANVGQLVASSVAIPLPDVHWEPLPGPRAQRLSAGQDENALQDHIAPQQRPAIATPAAQALAQADSRASHGSEADELPQVVANAAPVYPPELLAARVEGRVVLRVMVSAAGRVERLSIHQSSGRDAFDQAALASVRGWRFKPAMLNGTPVEYQVAVPVRFVIDPDASRAR